MTERKRATGFVLMDAAFTADRKFLRLYSLAPSPTDYAAAVGVFMLVLADARRARSHEVDFEEYSEYAYQLALLQEVRLLIPEGFDPETFDKWAPAYRSKWDEKYVRSGTERTGDDGADRSRTSSTDTSTHINSSHISSNGVGGVGEGEKPRAFMTFPPKKAKPLTQKEIESFRRSATEGLDPLVKANARQTLEKAGIPIEETRPS